MGDFPKNYDGIYNTVVSGRRISAYYTVEKPVVLKFAIDVTPFQTDRKS